jgi:hypothetical protein
VEVGEEAKKVKIKHTQNGNFSFVRKLWQRFARDSISKEEEISRQLPQPDVTAATPAIFELARYGIVKYSGVLAT